MAVVVTQSKHLDRAPAASNIELADAPVRQPERAAEVVQVDPSADEGLAESSWAGFDEAQDELDAIDARAMADEREIMEDEAAGGEIAPQAELVRAQPRIGP